MTVLKKKEKRTEILYAHVTKTNKKFLKGKYKIYGYSTLSEFVNVIFDEVRTKEKEGGKNE